MSRSHAILGPTLANVFIELRLSASILDLDVAQPDGEWIWYPIHRVADVTDFEQGYSVEKQRELHNVRSVRRARREGKLVLGNHAGLYDLYVPIAQGKTPPADLAPQKVDNGAKQVPSSLLDTIAIKKDNIDSTVVKDGFLDVDQICTAAYKEACKEAGLQ